MKDTKEPQVYCKNLATSIGNQGVEIWAKDFDNGSSDLCTQKDKLRFSFSETNIVPSQVFTCADIPNGVQADITITLWVFDENGNKAACIATLTLQDNSNLCTNINTLLADIGGKITNEAGQVLDSVYLDLMLSQIEPKFTKQWCDVQGQYKFESNPLHKDYNITPTKNVDWLNGVSTLDLVLIQRHILGLENISSPYLMIAADVNHDNRISAADLVLLRKLILGVIDKVDVNTSWRFVSKSYTFDDIQNPWQAPNTDVIDSLLKTEMFHDFIGIKVGDLNLSADPNINQVNVEKRSIDGVKLLYKMEKYDFDDKIKIGIYSDTILDAKGFQMALKVHGSVPFVMDGQLHVEPDMMHFTDEEWRLSYIADGIMRIGKNEPLFYLVIDKANQIALSETFLRSEWYHDNLTSVNPIKLVQWLEQSDESSFVVYNNIPNPFKIQTIIAFDLPGEDEVELEIRNVKSEVVYQIKEYFTKGHHQFIYHRSNIPAGVYTYSVKSKFGIRASKMIVI